MADLQFMAFELDAAEDCPEEGWALIDAKAVIAADSFGQRRLRLLPKNIRRTQAPESLIMDSRR